MKRIVCLLTILFSVSAFTADPQPTATYSGPKFEDPSPTPKQTNQNDELWNRMLTIKEDSNQLRKERDWNQQIKGEKISMCGRIRRITKEIFGDNPKVEMTTNGPAGKNQNIDITVIFLKTETSKLIDLNEGDTLCFTARVGSYAHLLVEFDFVDGKLTKQ